MRMAGIAAVPVRQNKSFAERAIVDELWLRCNRLMRLKKFYARVEL